MWVYTLAVHCHFLLEITFPQVCHLATYLSNFRAFTLKFVSETSPKQVDSSSEIVRFGRKIVMSSSMTVRKSIFIRAQQNLLELTDYSPRNYNSVKYMGKRDGWPPLYCRANTTTERKMWRLLKWTDILNIYRVVKERCHHTFQSRAMHSKMAKANQNNFLNPVTLFSALQK